jgi:hypothetical protein
VDGEIRKIYCEANSGLHQTVYEFILWLKGAYPNAIPTIDKKDGE